MRRRTRLVAILAVLAIAALAAYEMDLATSGPQVSVSPAANLVDGESVTVRVVGFKAGSKVWISECATAASANALGCGAEVAGQAFSVAGNDRTGSATFTVHARAQAGPFDTGPIEACSDGCVVVATLGGGQAFATTRITFEAP